MKSGILLCLKVTIRKKILTSIGRPFDIFPYGFDGDGDALGICVHIPFIWIDFSITKLQA